MPEPLQKSIILFVVEGSSDSIALKIPLRNLLRNYGFGDRFEVDVYGTDPLIHNCREKNNPLLRDPADVLDRVRHGVSDYLKSSKNKKIIRAADISAVILISDLDACFCSPNSIVQNQDSASEIVYDTANKLIHCKNVQYIKERNEAKKDSIGIILNYGNLALTSGKKAIPLGIFYFNINREHALNGINKQGMDEMEKRDIAIEFRKDYSEKWEEFRSLLESKLPENVTSYSDSWNESLLGRYAFLPVCNLILITQWLKESLNHI